MYAVLEKNNKILENVSEKNIEYSQTLLAQLEESDRTKQIFIENELFELGLSIMPSLIAGLKNSCRKVQAAAATVLIRLGSASIAALQQAFRFEKNNKWVADYIISEIQQ